MMVYLVIDLTDFTNLGKDFNLQSFCKSLFTDHQWIQGRFWNPSLWWSYLLISNCPLRRVICQLYLWCFSETNGLFPGHKSRSNLPHGSRIFFPLAAHLHIFLGMDHKTIQLSWSSFSEIVKTLLQTRIRIKNLRFSTEDSMGLDDSTGILSAKFSALNTESLPPQDAGCWNPEWFHNPAPSFT